MVIAEQTSLLDAARALRPVVEQYRDQGEAERTMSEPLVDAVRAAGIFRMWTAKSLGGIETDMPTSLRVIEELSRYDGAAGWTVMIGSGGGAFLSYIAEDEARALAGEGARNIGAGALAPKGMARVVDGGYRVTGRWPFGSGCMHANWHCGSTIVMDGEQPRMGPEGIPDIQLLFWPASDGEIIDTWYSAGLRGTGSHDLAVNDLFVPEGRAASLLYGRAQQPGAHYRDTIITVLPPQVAAVALGIARAAIDAFVDLAKGGKTPAFSMTRIVDRATVQAQVAQAEGLLRSARALFYETTSALWDTLVAGSDVSEELRTLVLLTTVNTATSCAKAVDMMYTAGGGTSVYATSKLERCFRDIHALTQHAVVSPSNWENTGKYFLGLGLGRF